MVQYYSGNWMLEFYGNSTYLACLTNEDTGKKYIHTARSKLPDTCDEYEAVERKKHPRIVDVCFDNNLLLRDFYEIKDYKEELQRIITLEETRIEYLTNKIEAKVMKLRRITDDIESIVSNNVKIIKVGEHTIKIYGNRTLLLKSKEGGRWYHSDTDIDIDDNVTVEQGDVLSNTRIYSTEFVLGGMSTHLATKCGKIAHTISGSDGNIKTAKRKISAARKILDITNAAVLM